VIAQPRTPASDRHSDLARDGARSVHRRSPLPVALVYALLPTGRGVPPLPADHTVDRMRAEPEMAPPYTHGQTLAWLSLDPDGVRVQRATVRRVEPTETGWRVTTDHGIAAVDHAGVGATAVPIDAEIETALYIHRDSYLVRATTMELERTLDQEYELGQDTALNRDSALDVDDDLGLD